MTKPFYYLLFYKNFSFFVKKKKIEFRQHSLVICDEEALVTLYILFFLDANNKEETITKTQLRK